MSFYFHNLKAQCHLENNIGCLSQLKVAFGDEMAVMWEVYWLTPMTPHLHTVLRSKDLWWKHVLFIQKHCSFLADLIRSWWPFMSFFYILCRRSGEVKPMCKKHLILKHKHKLKGNSIPGLRPGSLRGNLAMSLYAETVLTRKPGVCWGTGLV